MTNNFKLEDIGFYTLSDARAKQCSEKSPLWRCELLLTNRCNFNCPYCRGLQDNDLMFDDAVNILELWITNGLKNIRFSGGEPTLYTRLIELVEICKNNDVEHIALSTNGSADFSLYKDLFDYGINDFSISLDACCSSTSDMMSGTKGYWSKVISNIAALSELTYVTTGIVYDERNEREIIDVIELAHNLGVSDIRIIPAAQYARKMDISVRAELLAKYPILKYRVSGNHKVRGLYNSDTPRCRLVLDDMAVWNNRHYPCIIYLREGGQPIGNVSDKMRHERFLWSENHDSKNDPICLNNCLDVCCEYNNRTRN